MPNWEEIRQEWETTKITLVALADKYNIKIGTLKSRKSREGWSRGSPKKVATITGAKTQPKKAEKEPVVENGDLTDKQRLFCIYYLKYFNATKAYQKAYECDYFTAKANGSRLLTKANISTEIDRLKAEQAAELKLDVKDVLQKYIDIAFADITDFVEFGQKSEKGKQIVGFEEDGEPIYTDTEEKYNYVSFKNFDEVDGTIITEVRKGKDGVAVKLADKMKALEVLSKYFDLLPEAQKRKLEEEKLKMEISQLNGETEGDAHEQSSSYEEALNAQVEDVFADEVVGDEEE
ncbi:terminase small subunit [Cytobacillus firmus]|uniref:terminase small subunit n=1 Tax=Cytobacillus firmus TaxID=1399 RepID=UPI0018CF6122|nr:terminase small subunit [Cytobacillus firmus]MBG9548338.1 terminase [Cytobacillus firmus]MBG9600812.1 terminase [Cytobacillus firmus]MED1938929.1 terminase small subunit [Cytobacillus firmus]